MRNVTVRSVVAPVVTVVVVLFLVMPLIVVWLFSFHATSSLNLPFEGFSLQWYQGVFEDVVLRDAVVTTLQVAVAVTIVTTVLATAAAYGLTIARRRVERNLRTVLLLPLLLPYLFIGLSLFQFFVRIGLQLSGVTIVIAQVVVIMPVFVVLALVTFERLDETHRELGADLGATPWQVFARIVLPQTWPVLAAGAALTFALSLDEFPVTFWVAGEVQTVPLFLYARIIRTIDPTINAVATLLMAITILALLLAFLIVRRNERRTRAAVTE